MKKLLVVAAMIGTLSTPAAAGHSSPKYLAAHNGRTVIHQPGFDSFAMTPRSGPSTNSNSPEATGGGSLGYNEMLRYYWQLTCEIRPGHVARPNSSQTSIRAET
jgi:opacity protein-like surface antigen